ncbi:conserved hypothetical protein [Lausannevirus]|uniref:MORN repeat-containing protein n=2 Tax=Lausannevirus TaxID=999883 RepID=A0A0N9PUL0_9VIRU|nr:hypothetical protein LAU_0289 [Lausannevirus]AEA07140.1 conserved hypothetical protein [Lausannevirus]ALH06958.1 hypothetical protein PMV_260 [Port-miou virus]
MESLQTLCLNFVGKCHKEKTLKSEEFRKLPFELLEKVCEFIPTSTQIRIFGLCVRWTKGVMREKAYYNGSVLHGPFTKWDQNGNVLEEAEYCKGRKHGRFVQYNPSKNTVHLLENYRNGELHGERKVYENGVVRKTEVYKKGVREGEKKVFFGDGKSVNKSLSFHKGKKEGRCIKYDKDGNIVKEVLWVRGIRVGSSR